MKKLPLQFKESHLCYCANYIKRTAITSFGYLFADLRAALKDQSYQPNDNVSIEVDPQTLLNLHGELGGREERLTAGIHQQLKASLGSQLMALAGNPDQDIAASAQCVLGQLQERDQQIDAWIANEITEGREYIIG